MYNFFSVSLSLRTAQFEHTVLITDSGVEVLTADTKDWHWKKTKEEEF